MSKLVPVSEEKEYIKAYDACEEAKAHLQVHKLRMLNYVQKGYEFHLIRPSDTSGGVFSPPWKKICLELIAKLYPQLTDRKKFMSSLVRKYPRTFRAPVLNIIGRKVKKEEFV